MLRLAGEILAAMIVIIAVLIALVGGQYFGLQNLDILPLFNEIVGGGGNSIVALLFIIVAAIVYAFWVLIIFYFLAELLSVGVTIAHNSMAIRSMLSKGVAAPTRVAETFEEEIVVREPPKPIELRCDNCNNVVSADDAFCMNCGNKLK
ncbi:MAG: zinc ribbon domain-containing protein [Chitinophagaceae bacterium]|nr:zinc ribbon domain-containing protein [Chitinophagaceae bacterium]